MNARRRIAGSNSAALAGLLGCLVLLVGLGIAAPAVRAEGPTIVIHDGAFDPPTVTVHAGEAVSWTNASSRSVEVITADGTLDSGEVAPGGGSRTCSTLRARSTITWAATRGYGARSWSRGTRRPVAAPARS